MILKNGKRLDGCSDTVPIGTINPYIGSVAPYGYLICEGQLVSKTTYKELYEICGDKFGTGTATEFRLPDLRGKTIVGYKEGDSTFGTLGGLLGSLTHIHTTGNHTLTIDEMPKHVHNFDYWNNWDGSGKVDLGGGSGAVARLNKWVDWTGDNAAGMQNAGGDKPHNHGDTEESSSLQPSLTMNWIVKAFLLMPNQSYVSTVNQDSDINTYSCNYINTMLTHNHVRKTINNQSGFTDLSPFTTTVTKDGFAIIQVRLLTASATAGMTIRILKNGSAINHSYYHNLPDATELNEQAMIDVKKGDVISLNNDQGKFYGTDLYNTFDMVII